MALLRSIIPLGKVNWVEYKYGATVVQTEGIWGGVTQGSYIVGDERIEADANNSLFQHEYGHYIQSQAMGWAYYGRVGIPSIMSNGNHDFHPVEQDANRRAFLYFNENVDGFYVSDDDFNNGVNRGWDFFLNPLNIDGTNMRNQYVDYRNRIFLNSLNRIRVRAKWYDYTFPIISGFYNAWWYNH